MYKNRIKVSQEELNSKHRSVKYLITNRIVGGSFILGDLEKQKLLKLMVDGQKRHAYRLVDYVLIENHYHAILELKPPEEMSDEDLLERWYMQSRVSMREPKKEELEEFRKKIHDISFVVGNFEQRFVQWYNKKKNRLGSLFNRFDSVIIGKGQPLAALMAYITLNPVRANICSDPAEYHWCGYARRVAQGKLNEYDIELVEELHRTLHIPPQIQKLPEPKQLKLLWKYFRQRLMRAAIKAHRTKCDWPTENTVGAQLDEQEMKRELGYADHFMLKIRFATKGIAIGSQEFVDGILNGCGKALGYKRKHQPCEHHIWDEIHSLKRHRKPGF